MIDYVIGALLLLILGAAVWYIVKAKKSGKKCIGCPESGRCDRCHSSCGGNK